MCGLVGVAGYLGQNEKKMFRDMLVMDQLRGFDSTGVFYVGKQKCADNFYQSFLEKTVGCAQNLWEYGSTILDYGGVSKGQPKLLMGHNRAATVGKVTEENAHPFSYGNITGAHNGSLRHWADLEGADKLDVDSKAIFNDIDVHGIDHTWKSFFGAAALTFWDKKHHQLNLIRNSERPLITVLSKDGRTLFWASELWMIQGAAWRQKVDLESNNQGQTLYTSLTVDTLYKFDIGMSNVSLVEERELEKKAYPKVTPTTQVAGFMRNGGSSNNTTSHKNVKLDEFQPVAGWRDNTLSCDFVLEDVEITSGKFIVRQGFITGVTEYVFRFVLRKGVFLIGELDIYPRNKIELKKFIKIANDLDNGESYDFLLIDNPRLCENQENKSYKRYVGLPSIILHEKVNRVIPIPQNKVRNDGPCKNYKGEFVSTAEMLKDIEGAGSCCSYCSSNLYTIDSKNFYWFSKTEVLCPECATNWAGNYEQLFG